jgi:CubicO group peptidase (beta-lactamase class C family)
MIGGLSKTRMDRMHDVMAAHVEHGAAPGVVTLVARGEDVHIDTVGTMAVDSRTPIQRDSIFRVSSMTKPVTAVAAMILVEECVLRLDDPVDEFLPEVASVRVLRSIEAEVDDTVAKHRPVTLRDLLTFRLGAGLILAPPGTYPIQRAWSELGGDQGPPRPGAEPPPDEWMRRFFSLPLVHQPGEQWMYHSSADVLGVLIARASGRPLDVFMRERILDPLGMDDTGFFVPPDKLGRLTTSYTTDPVTGALELYDAPDGEWSTAPAFPSGGGGLVSTADDFLAFGRMLLNGGELGGERILARGTVELMTTNQLPAEQRTGLAPLLEDFMGWGFGMSIVMQRTTYSSVGSYGWAGGLGTSWQNDPAEGLIGVMLTQAAFTSPTAPPMLLDFWTGAYQALED